ncbi:hypothetical protein COOONC_07121 [Cooperia oncophora]
MVSQVGPPRYPVYWIALFDLVCHRRLLVKLQHLGISGQLLDWLRSFLNQRYMTVRVRHSFSDRHHCQSGIPQGGILSSLLF